MSNPPDLVSQMLSGDRLALSRLISRVEGRSPDLLSIMSRVQTKAGHARCIGVTGPPGAGKSTLVDCLIAHFRKEGKKVGVVAIDPSSPFSGGAVLGDRIRMQAHAGDEAVFIRSLGSRGSHGGLSRATREVVKLYRAFGMDVVLVETVGVGQTELDVMEIADTTVVILTPESGDAIQTLKAGILEIADIFVVNKFDRDGAHLMQAELKAMIEIGDRKRGGWQTPVLLVQASKNIGVEELASSLEGHSAFLQKSGANNEKRQKIAAEEVREIVFDEIRSRFLNQMKGLTNGQNTGKISNPYETAEKILKNWEKTKCRPSSPSTRQRARSSKRSSPPVKKKYGGR